MNTPQTFNAIYNVLIKFHGHTEQGGKARLPFFSTVNHKIAFVLKKREPPMRTAERKSGTSPGLHTPHPSFNYVFIFY